MGDPDEEDVAATTYGDGYNKCVERLHESWHDDMADYAEGTPVDVDLEEMVHDYCYTAHEEFHEADAMKRSKMKE